mmetsp:Transcript_28729/g.84989  ORF Transcript_28729/g.84989 Transcript_28729/m.84989 type:complete len:204 (+) Transcript_28729:126-737(+)
MQPSKHGRGPGSTGQLAQAMLSSTPADFHTHAAICPMAARTGHGPTCSYSTTSTVVTRFSRHSTAATASSMTPAMSSSLTCRRSVSGSTARAAASCSRARSTSCSWMSASAATNATSPTHGALGPCSVARARAMSTSMSTTSMSCSRPIGSSDGAAGSIPPSMPVATPSTTRHSAPSHTFTTMSLHEVARPLSSMLLNTRPML